MTVTTPVTEKCFDMLLGEIFNLDLTSQQPAVKIGQEPNFLVYRVV
jgi:hypothetical protein